MLYDERVQQAVEQAKERSVREERNRIDQDTLLMVDASSSMGRHFGTAQELGSRVVPICDGQHMTVLFNVAAQVLDVGDGSLASIQKAFRGKRAGGMTSMKAGLDLALRYGMMPQQIIVMTDGGENSGRHERYNGLGAFASTLNEYAGRTGTNPNVVVVGLGNYDSRFADSVRRFGFTVDEFQPPEGEYDWNLYDQIVAVLMKEPGVTLVQQIMETVIPRMM